MTVEAVKWKQVGPSEKLSSSDQEQVVAALEMPKDILYGPYLWAAMEKNTKCVNGSRKPH